MLGRLISGLIFLCFTVSLGLSEVSGTATLLSLDEVAEMSKKLKAVQAEVKKATVCIDLGGGSSGSGVIVSKDGLVLSAAHVTQEVDKKLTAILEDGTEYEMVGLGLDTTNDASFAQIILPEDASPLPYVERVQEVELGQYVFALGHAGGFDVKRGSVLRLGRIQELSETSLVTDCVLIGGDSGGPLFDLEGRLIAIHSRVGTVTSSNTHVPVKVYEDQWEELKGGELKGDGTFADAGFPFLGMHLMEVDGELQVTNVVEKTRAEEIGVQEGDVLVRFNGEEVKTGADVLNVLTSLEITPQGVDVELSFLRGEKSWEAKFLFND